MNTKELLQAMTEDIFGQRYQQELETLYNQDVSQGKLGTLEADYDTARANLFELLSPDQQELLRQYEDTAVLVRQFHGSYGFLAGLYSGFHQRFTDDASPDGGFQQLVVEELQMLPRQCRHSENLQHMEQAKALMETLQAQVSPALQKDLLSVDCAWEQRAYSASVHGFYLGYHFSLELCDYVSPNPENRLGMLGKLLSMEHMLGFSHPAGSAEMRRVG